MPEAPAQLLSIEGLTVSYGEVVALRDVGLTVGTGEAVALTGKFVCSKRIVDDDQYQTYAPAMVAYLLDKPFAMLEPETIFAPQEL